MTDRHPDSHEVSSGTENDCSDCFMPLDDPAHHCQECGDHVDALGECQSGCEL